MDRDIVLVTFILVGCVVVCVLLKRYYQNRMEAVYQILYSRWNGQNKKSIKKRVYIFV